MQGSGAVVKILSCVTPQGYKVAERVQHMLFPLAVTDFVMQTNSGWELVQRGMLKGHGEGVANANNMEHFGLECVEYEAVLLLLLDRRTTNSI